LKAARLHPLKILVAMRQYAQGRGEKGSLTWDPVKKVEKALEDAFYASFDFVEPTGKNIMLCLDVSGSMTSPFYNGMSCIEAEICLAMVTARTEKNHHIMKFHDQFVPVPVNPHAKLEDIVRMIYDGRFGGTDCSLPMQYAIKEELDIDTFVVYTDSETWKGNGSPARWLKEYRRRMNKPNAQLIVVAFTATGFTIADPADPNMMDIAGFDTAIPTIMNMFIKHEL
jgi:60 kDa SS-A/Ro ribonucleoprotein